jgi:hypothetical protein
VASGHPRGGWGWPHATLDAFGGVPHPPLFSFNFFFFKNVFEVLFFYIFLLL